MAVWKQGRVRGGQFLHLELCSLLQGTLHYLPGSIELRGEKRMIWVAPSHHIPCYKTLRLGDGHLSFSHHVLVETLRMHNLKLACKAIM